MIYEYSNLTPIDYPRLLGGLLPEPENALWFWLIGALLLALSGLGTWRGSRTENTGFVASASVLAGTYIYSSRWTDEVFINLEHPYNLWHHGRFSAASGAWTDGTVEFIYHLLLLPVAGTRELLIQGNYCLGFLIALAHLVLFRRWLRSCPPLVQTAALISFAFFVPFVEVCSSGFGNSLVSLCFFYCLTHLVLEDGVPGRGLAAAAVLPFLRPDAIVFSIVCFLLAAALGKRLASWPLACLGALAAYFLTVRLFYGHFVPTPMAFKAFHPSMLPLLELRPSCDPEALGWCWSGTTDVGFLVTWTRQLFLAPSVLCAAGVVLLSAFFDPDQPARRQWLLLRLSLVPLALIATAYIATALGYNPTLYRYYAPFLLMVGVVPLHYGATLCSWLIRKHSGRWQGQFGWLPAALALVCAVAGLWLIDYPQGHKGRGAGGSLSLAEPERLDDFLFAGEAVDRLLPPTWKIAVTEMATFSFMNDREVVDLWGYTSPRIAKSEVCSQALLRNDPAFFLDQNPEVLWVRTEVPWALYAAPQDKNYEALFARWIFSRWVNLGGDMNKVMARYDVFKLEHFADRHTLLLVRKDFTESFQRRLSKSSFNRTGTRPFRLELFSKLYGKLPSVQHDCS